jgi:formylglycine-generating enzyme required for sulfatase activity
VGKSFPRLREYWVVMGINSSYFNGDNLPVECVSWYDAIEYCNVLSRLEGLIPAYTINGEYGNLEPRGEWIPAAHGSGMGVCVCRAGDES